MLRRRVFVQWDIVNAFTSFKSKDDFTDTAVCQPKRYHAIESFVWVNAAVAIYVGEIVLRLETPKGIDDAPLNKYSSLQHKRKSAPEPSSSPRGELGVSVGGLVVRSDRSSCVRMILRVRIILARESFSRPG